MIKPHPGRQEKFLSSPADVAIYGGAAGGGKTFSSIIEPLRHIANPRFSCVILRRTTDEIKKPGGLWDESNEIYPLLGAVSRISNLDWTFPSGAKVVFGHCEHEKDVQKWHGSQVPLIIFDELTTFTERQFWYLFSRNRSTCGVRPYIRATCNPDASSWVAQFVSWYIDPDTGYPLPEREGVVRWFINHDRKLHWADSPEELVERFPKSIPKSFTFVPATLADNPTLEKIDPQYRANLMALPAFDRARLLEGNWKQRPDGGEFDAAWFEDAWFERWPDNMQVVTMALDPSKGKDARKGDYQAFVRVGLGADNMIYVQANMGRRPIPQMVADGVDLYRQWAPHAFGLETNAWQDLLAPDFDLEFEAQNVIAPSVFQLQNTVNKLVRIRRLAGYLAHRRMRFLADCPSTKLLVDQLLDFPNGVHDDGPDALEMAIRLAEELTRGT